MGPDGAVYVCDWYDGQVNHYKNHQGNIDPTNGRIYRIAAERDSDYQLGDLSKLSSDNLVDLLSHPNRWVRQTTLRLLGDRKDKSVSGRLRKILGEQNGQVALEALWALNLIGGLDSELYALGLGHENPYVRIWAVRLLGDQRSVGEQGERLVRLASTETDVEVRQQLAASARRMRSDHRLRILLNLLRHDEDTADVYQPLMIWWGIESCCRDDANQVIEAFETQTDLWRSKISNQWILSRLMQRFAMEGSRADLQRCARLLSAAPKAEAKTVLMKGFEEAYRGRPLPQLPESLASEIAKVGGGSLPLRLRQGSKQASKEALVTIADPSIAANSRIELIRLAGELRIEGLPAVICEFAADPKTDAVIRQAAIGALQNYTTDEVATWAIDVYEGQDNATQKLLQELLSSRVEWAKVMFAGIDEHKIDPLSLTVSTVRRCSLLANKDATLRQTMLDHGMDDTGATTQEMKAEVDRLSVLLNERTGDVYHGQELFRNNCGKCHKLFIDGGDIGPDLTTYQRSDVANMVLNVVNPNAEIREGFENYLVLTDEGRVITGLMVDRDNKVVVLRTSEGQTVTIDRDSIEESRVLGKSLMPEGLLKSLTDDDIVDLFSYLRSTQPLNN